MACVGYSAVIMLASGVLNFSALFTVMKTDMNTLVEKYKYSTSYIKHCGPSMLVFHIAVN
jgi:hypothetical protein